MILNYLQYVPQLGHSVFVAEGARVIGNVEIGECSSVWYNTVIRGDMAPIRIGKSCNIQDLCMIHVNQGQPVTLEDEVTVGHGVILHSCTIKRGSLIGMGAIVMSGSVINEETIVAAGSLIPEHKVFPPRVLLMGSPARVARELTETEILSLHQTAERYTLKAHEHLKSKEIIIE